MSRHPDTRRLAILRHRQFQLPGMTFEIRAEGRAASRCSRGPSSSACRGGRPRRPSRSRPVWPSGSANSHSPRECRPPWLSPLVLRVWRKGPGLRHPLHCGAGAMPYWRVPVHAQACRNRYWPASDDGAWCCLASSAMSARRSRIAVRPRPLWVSASLSNFLRHVDGTPCTRR